MVPSGYQSSAGRCFDIGNLTRDALGVWRRAVIAADYAAKSESSPQAQQKAQTAVQEAQVAVEKRFNQIRYCSNGSLMRVLPVALLFADDLPAAVKAAAESSRVTHPHPRCVMCCALYTVLATRCLEDAEVSKERLVGCMVDFVDAVGDVVAAAESSSSASTFKPKSKAKTTTGAASSNTVSSASSFITRFERYTTIETFLDTPASAIRSTGSVLDTLEAALWAFFTTPTFRDGALTAVNLGGDADTVGAVYGGLAGAFYGEEEVPAKWVGALKGRELVEEVLRRIVGVWEERGREQAYGEKLNKEDGAEGGGGCVGEQIRSTVDKLGL